MTTRRSLRALSLSAAILIGAGGSLAASPSFAAKPTAATTGAAHTAFQTKAFDAGAVGVGTSGKNVIVAVDTSADKADKVLALDDAYSNVRFLKLNGPIKPAAKTDVVGGAGYIDNVGALCSLAFSAWTPHGKEAAITAGHCKSSMGDGSIDRTTPSTDVEFRGGEKDEMPKDQYRRNSMDALGTFGFAQWGGKNNPFAPQSDPTVTDIGLIEKTNGDLTMKPAVTDWTTKASDDLSLSAQQITAVGTARKGGKILKSGRTTGLTDGTVLGNMVFAVADIDDPKKARFVRGFVATNTLRPGDSGGAWFNTQGEALGVSSAYAVGQNCQPGQQNCSEEDFAFVTDINHGLTQLPKGTEVKLFVKAPGKPGGAPAVGNRTAAAPAEFSITAKPGQTITGEIETNAVIEAVKGSTAPENLTSKDGKYSFTAPTTAGEYTYKLQARKGRFNVSEPITIKVTVEESAAPSPTATPTATPTGTPTADPTATPTSTPTGTPTGDPTASPTATSTPTGTPSPTSSPTDTPAERALTISPEKITAADFVKKNAVQIAATGCTPGTEAKLSVKPRGSKVTGHTDTATVAEKGTVGFAVFGENADTPNVYLGDYDVTVTCDGGSPLTGAFTVTNTADDDGKGGDDGNGKGDDTTGDDTKLPRTGSETLGTIGTAAALIAGGAGLYVLARRRKN